MATNSKIGKQHFKGAAQPLSTIVTPQFPNLPKITLDEWKFAGLQAKNPLLPNRWLLYQTYDNVDIDGALTALINKRIIKVQKAKFNIIDKKTKKPDTEKTELLQKLWFNDLLKYMMEAKFWGFSLVEIFSFLENGEIDKINLIDRYHVKPEMGIVTKTIYEYTGLTYLDGPIANYYFPIGDVKDLGLLYKAAPLIIAIKYALGNWGTYNEKIGIPFRYVTSPGINKTRQQQLGIIMEQMGSAGWAVINENEKIELLQNSGSDPTKCFEQLIAKLDDRLALLLVGQSGTTNSHQNKGTYGSMKMLADISEDIHDADLIYCGYYINNVLLPKLRLYGYDFSDNDVFAWDKTVDISVPELVEFVTKLETFYDLDYTQISDKIGITILGRKPVPGTPPPPPPKMTAVKKKVLINAKAITKFYAQACCSGHNAKYTAAAAPDFDKIMRGVAKRIFDGTQDGFIDKAYLNATAKHLVAGLTKGYVTPSDGLSQSDKDLFQSLKENVYVFSGFKTEKMLKAASALLLDDNGETRTKSDFIKQVLNLNPTYNKSWLDAEYDNALISSDMGSKWLKIQNQKDVLPWLVFDATLDNRTTSICRGLDGLTARADDPIWEKWFLPLHFHERSNILQAATGTPTDQSKILWPDVSPMFSQNVGVTGVAFPDTHPYFNDVSYKQAKQITKEALDVMKGNSK